MIITPISSLANILDHRFRGRNLLPGDKGLALQTIGNVVTGLHGVDCPRLDDVLDFIAERGPFNNSGSFECSPFHFWSALYAAQVATYGDELPLAVTLLWHLWDVSFLLSLLPKQAQSECFLQLISVLMDAHV